MTGYKNFAEVGVDWAGPGYFATLLSAADLGKLPASERVLWSAWQDRLLEAKRGDFRRIIELVDIYGRTESWRLGDACAGLLGDAGTAACLRHMADRSGKPSDAIINFTMQIEFACAFATAGVLAFLPMIVETYREYHRLDDADILPFAVSHMLEPSLEEFAEPKAYPSLEDYCAAVLDRHAELSTRLGPRAIVFRGEIFSVRRLARAVLDEVVHGKLDLWHRQQFEASTGIETAQFYKGDRLQPLTAAAIGEDVLASPAAAQYVDGARYFFGRRIPESAE